MRHAAQTRRELGIRTAFNLLGPLTNPVEPRRQIVGVPRPELTELLARALMLLGAERAWVVHGADGLDEISTTGYTKVSECRDGVVQTFYVHPGDFGLPKAAPAALRGGDAADNAAAIIRACWRARRGRRGTSCCSMPAPRCSWRARAQRAGRDRRGRCGARRRARDARAGPPRGGDRGWGRNGAARAERHDTRTCWARSSRPRADASRRVARRRAARRRFARGGWPRRPTRAVPARAGRAGPCNVIAECKRRSPSRGVLRGGLRPASASPAAYEAAGAAAISVLTEPTFFDGVAGAPAGRPRGRRAAAPPQGLHRRRNTSCSRRALAGADAVLLIVAALGAAGAGVGCSAARGARARRARRGARRSRAGRGDRARARHRRRQQPQPAHARRVDVDASGRLIDADAAKAWSP